MVPHCIVGIVFRWNVLYFIIFYHIIIFYHMLSYFIIFYHILWDAELFNVVPSFNIFLDGNLLC